MHVNDGLSAVDIFIKLHTAVRDRQRVIQNPIETAKYYLRSSFIIDLISCIPLELVILPLFKDTGSRTTQQIMSDNFIMVVRVLQAYKVKSNKKILLNFKFLIFFKVLQISLLRSYTMGKAK